MYILPELPYELNALEPHIDRKTLEFHYGKHHQAYVNNLNKMVPGTELEGSSLEELVVKSDGGVFNNAAQVWNHTFYFESLSPNGGGAPAGELADAINRDFGSFENFKDQYAKAAATLFGAGWAWLAQNNDGRLTIVQEGNAGNPLRSGLKPLLTIDVWEHAYYLDYQNKRPDYIDAFFEIIDWKVVASRL